LCCVLVVIIIESALVHLCLGQTLKIDLARIEVILVESCRRGGNRGGSGVGKAKALNDTFLHDDFAHN
jgi:hypothetical protein